MSLEHLEAVMGPTLCPLNLHWGFSANSAGTHGLLFGSFYLASAVEGQTGPGEVHGGAVVPACASPARSFPSEPAGSTLPWQRELTQVGVLHLACLLQYQEPKRCHQSTAAASSFLPLCSLRGRNQALEMCWDWRSLQASLLVSPQSP